MILTLEIIIVIGWKFGQNMTIRSSNSCWDHLPTIVSSPKFNLGPWISHLIISATFKKMGVIWTIRPRWTWFGLSDEGLTTTKISMEKLVIFLLIYCWFFSHFFQRGLIFPLYCRFIGLHLYIVDILAIFMDISWFFLSNDISCLYIVSTSINIRYIDDI